jgi:hypothetical protein
MNRRRFLTLLAGAGAASATSYFLPPIGGWHSDVIVKPSEWALGGDVEEVWPPYIVGSRPGCEARLFSIEEICRIFQVAPHLVLGPNRRAPSTISGFLDAP